MAGRQYQIRKPSGLKLGPFGSKEVKQLAADGKISPDDEISDLAQQQWQKANKVKGLLIPPRKPDAGMTPVSASESTGHALPEATDDPERPLSNRSAPAKPGRHISRRDIDDANPQPEPPAILNQKTEEDIQPPALVDQQTEEDIQPPSLVDQEPEEDIQPPALVDQQTEEDIQPPSLVDQQTEEDIEPPALVDQHSEENTESLAVVDHPFTKDTESLGLANPASAADTKPSTEGFGLTEQVSLADTPSVTEALTINPIDDQDERIETMIRDIPSSLLEDRPET